EELRVAKEVGVRLNNELDLLDEKRVYYEEENRQLNEELQTSQNKRIAVENELGRLKLETKSQHYGSLWNNQLNGIRHSTSTSLTTRKNSED
ncbi:unnamed protein product, partial [Schistosoma mattheei]